MQGISRDRVTLLSSGYSEASRNRAQTQLVKPTILKVLNEISGQLTMRVSPVANARNYQAQIQVGDGAWQEAGFFTQARRMVLTNLTPGTIYNMRVRAAPEPAAGAWSPARCRCKVRVGRAGAISNGFQRLYCDAAVFEAFSAPHMPVRSLLARGGFSFNLRA